MLQLQQFLFLYVILLGICIQHSVQCTFLEPVGDVLYDEENVIKNINLVCYKKSLEDFHIYNHENIEKLVDDNAVFNRECETKLYIPGYDQDLNADTTIVILTSYFKIKEKCPNICQLNYTYYSRQSVPKAFLATDTVGSALAILLEKLFLTNDLDRTKFSCVGHSLGGQVCGAFGRHTEPKISSIVGLDPAGPGFNVALKSIATGQAQCVICVRTDEGLYGIKRTVCDINVLANGGTRFQPDCPLDSVPLSLSKDDLCSHHRSVNMTANAILYPELFLLVRCEQVKSRRRQAQCECDYENPIKLTELLPKCLHESLRGNFYFSTSGVAPYGLGIEGAKKERFTFLSC